MPTIDQLTARIERDQRNTLIGFIVLLVGLAGAFYVQSHETSEQNRALVNTAKVVAVEGCNRDFKTIQAARASVLRSQANSKRLAEAGALDKDQYQRTVAINAKLLGDLVLPDCRAAASAITSDARDVKFPPPNPLYP